MTLRVFVEKIKNKAQWEWKNRQSLFFRLNSKIHRFMISTSKEPRPGSEPYISGDTFRNLAHHKEDKLSEVVPENVKKGDIVFVDIHLIEDFFKTKHTKINKPYKLITHNGDKAITKEYLEYVDTKIIKWFGQNVEVEHPKIIPIPIGLENKWYYYNGIPSYFKRARQSLAGKKKKTKILFGFNVATNTTKRQAAYNSLVENKNTEKIQGFPHPAKYLKLLSGYKFVASPEGNGIDCIRTWEAMYLKVVPIVTDSLNMRYFKKIGLPIHIVNNWDELKELDEVKLNNLYDTLESQFLNEALFFDYWKQKIQND